MAHEKSLTVQTDNGDWVNIPSVIDGEERSEAFAVNAFREGKIQPLGESVFADVKSAERAAKMRSDAFEDRLPEPAETEPTAPVGPSIAGQSAIEGNPFYDLYLKNLQKNIPEPVASSNVQETEPATLDEAPSLTPPSSKNEDIEWLESLIEGRTIGGTVKNMGVAFLRDPVSLVGTAIKGLAIYAYEKDDKFRNIFEKIKKAPRETQDYRDTLDREIQEIDSAAWNFDPSQIDPRVVLQALKEGVLNGNINPADLARPQERELAVEKQPLYKLGLAVDAAAKDFFAVNPKYEEALAVQVSGAVGQTAMAVALSVALRNPMISYALFIAAGSGEAAERAIEAGATTDQVLRAGGLGSLAGATNILAFEVLLSKFKIGGAIKNKLLRAVSQIGLKAFVQAAVEADQEGFEQFLQNVIAKYGYDGDQKLTEGVSEAMLIAFIAGGVSGAGIQAVQMGRGDVASDINGGVVSLEDTLRDLDAQRSAIEALTPQATTLPRPASTGPSETAEALTPQTTTFLRPASTGPSETAEEIVPDIPAVTRVADIPTVAEGEDRVKTARENVVRVEREAGELLTNIAEEDLSGVEPLIALFPDMQVTNQNAVAINIISEREVAALRRSGLVEEFEPDVGEKYEGVNVEKLWKLRSVFQARNAEAVLSGVSIEIFEPKAPSAPTIIPPEEIQEFTGEVSGTPNERAGVFMFNPQNLQVDPTTFQFKEADNSGRTPLLKGVTKWNPDAAGQLIVWERRDGALFVADGHQRVGLATQLLEGGAETAISIPGSLYREVDGFPAQDVMVQAAMKNIREGSGDILDAARVMRASPKEIESIAELGRAATRHAVALTDVSEEVWRMAVNGVIEAREAAIVGRIIPKDAEELQLAAAKVIVKVKPPNDAETEMLVRRVRSADLVAAEQGAQGSLLDDLDSGDTTVVEEISIVSRAIKTLGADKNTLRRVARNAGRIEETGSVIEQAQALSAADESAALSAIVEKVAFTAGPVRDALLDLAKDVKNGERTTNEAVETLIATLRGAERPGDPGGSEISAGGLADEVGGEIEDIFGAESVLKNEIAPKGEPIKIGSGQVLQSQSGREMGPAPKIDLGTDRKIANSLKRIDAWLVKEALIEADQSADTNKNDFVTGQINAINLKNVSPADRDMLNVILFGDAVGPTDVNLIEVILDEPTPPKAVTREIPEFEAVRQRLPKDATGEPDLQALTDEIASKTGKTSWGQLTDQEKVEVSQAFAGPAIPQVEFGMTEPGADGRPQEVFPGAERLTDAELAQRQANAPLRPRAAQRAPGGLFSDGSLQMDLVEMANAAGQATDFRSRLSATQNEAVPSAEGPDGKQYRIRAVEAGFVGLKIPGHGQNIVHLRPPEGETWTEAQAIEEVVQETEPNRDLFGEEFPALASSIPDNARTINIPGVAGEEATAEDFSNALPDHLKPLFETRKVQAGANMSAVVSLLSEGLYGRDKKQLAKVSVKELLQNSFDAVKGAIEAGTIVGDPKITFKVDADQRTIEIWDNGHGMSPDVLVKQFVEIAGTLKETERSSGGLGVAKIVILTTAEEIEVTTIRDGTISTLKTSGAELKNAYANPEEGPSIEINPVDDPANQRGFSVGEAGLNGVPGTYVKVSLPENFKNTSTGEIETIDFSRWEHDYAVLSKSPMFTDISVNWNGQELNNIGKTFPANDYTVFSKVDFDWGQARVYVSKNPPRNKWDPNVHVLSEGLWQFSFNLNKEGMGGYGDKIPRELYVDVSSSVKPQEAGYPFQLNRQGFSPSAKEDFEQVFQHIVAIYRNEDILNSAHDFGTIEYLDRDLGGVTTISQFKLEPTVPRRDSAISLIKEGEEVTVKDGLLVINGRDVPAISRDELRNTDINVDELLADPSMVNSGDVALHDNTEFTTDEFVADGLPLNEETRIGKSISEVGREKFGPRFDNFVYEIGDVFHNLRQSVLNIMELDESVSSYNDLAEEIVGISFDIQYRGVSTKVPVSGMFINPAGPEYNDAPRAAYGMAGTMIHELAHYKERNHSGSFSAEMQRLTLNLTVAALTSNQVTTYEIAGNRIHQTINDHKDVFDFLTETFNAGELQPRGKRFKDGEREVSTGGNLGDLAQARGRAGGAEGVSGQPSKGIGGCGGERGFGDLQDKLGRNRGRDTGPRGAASDGNELTLQTDPQPKLQRAIQIALDQRGDTEIQMVKIQFLTKGNVLNPAIERAGDLLNRGWKDLRFNSFAQGDMKTKIDTVKNRLNAGYNFERDMSEQLARAGVEQSALDAELSTYADLYRQFTGENPYQQSIIDLNVALGEQRWDDARSLADEIDDIITLPEAEYQAKVLEGLVPVEALPQPQTDTPQFKAWFRDSQVVDENGEPLVVFHGTSGDFDTFDLGQRGTATGAGSSKLGFFFASNPVVASSYAQSFDVYRDTSIGRLLNKLTGGLYERANEALLRPFGITAKLSGENVLPVFLSIQNPFVADLAGGAYDEVTFHSIINEAAKAGHDGVIFRNTLDEGFIEGASGVPTDAYVAFSPIQIKSATGNSGAFDPDNPVIVASSIPPPFYSKALRVVEEAKTAKASPSQWIATLKNAGVKAEESDWIGLDDFLNEKARTGGNTVEEAKAFLLEKDGVDPEENYGFISPEDYITVAIDGGMKPKGVKSIPREAVSDFVRQNQVTIQEVVLGGITDRDQVGPSETASAPFKEEWERLSAEIAEKRNLFSRGEPIDGMVGDEVRFDIIEGLEDQRTALHEQMVDATIEEMGGLGGRVKFDRPSLQLPGGENYREVLLTLGPSKEQGSLFDDYTVVETPQGEFAVQGIASDGVGHRINTYGSQQMAEETVLQYRAEGLPSHVVRSLQQRINTGDFTEGHFGDIAPNILAHVRMNERTDADGKRTLFIEEIQSDWHQAGRRRGFKQPIRMPSLQVENYAEEIAALDLATNTFNEFVPVIPPGAPRFAPNAQKEELWQLVEAADKALTEAVSNDLPEGFTVVIDSRSMPTLLATHPTMGSYTRAEAETFEELFSAIDGKDYEPFRPDDAVPNAPFKTVWPDLAMKRMIRWAAQNGFDQIAWTPGEVQADRYDLSKQVDELQLEPFSEKRDTFNITGFKDGSEVFTERDIPREGLPDYVGKDVAEKLVNKWEDTDTPTISLSGIDLQIGGKGMIAFYDRILVNIANKLGKKFGAKVGTAEIQTDAPGEVIQAAGTNRWFISRDNIIDTDRPFRTAAEAKAALGGATVHSLPLTEKMKASALAGFPLFNRVPSPAVKVDPNAEASVAEIMDRVAGTDVTREIWGIISDSGLGPKVRADEAAFVKAGGSLGGGTIGGETRMSSDGEAVIRIAVEDPLFSDVRQTTYHESYHRVEGQILNNSEWAIVNTDKAMAAARDFAGRAVNRPAESPAMLALAPYETRAIGFAEYSQLRDEGKPTKSITGYAPLDKLFEKIYRFISKMRRELFKGGYRTLDDIFEGAYQGELALRSRFGGRDITAPFGEGEGGLTPTISSSTTPSVPQTETPQFKTFFQGSKVVDDDGEPLVVYHGTTGDFDSFDLSRVNIESDLGGGFYFTNEVEDVGVNYAGEGPDLTGRIEREAERIAGETEREADAPDVMAEARNNLSVQNEGASLPVYLSMQNPVYLGGETPTFIESGITYNTDDYLDDARSEIADEADGEVDEDDVQQRALELAQEAGDESVDGGVFGMLDAIRGMTGFEFDGIDTDQLSADLDEMTFEGADAGALHAAMKASEGLAYATDENGNIASNEIIRRAFEAIGFDGFIDATVNQKFGTERDVGQSMEGMNEDTIHYVVFKPTQIKSAIGNRGTFDPNDPVIVRSAIPRQRPVKPAEEDIHEVKDASFEFGRVVGDRVVPMASLTPVGTADSDPERVAKLAEEISGDEGFITRLIIDTEGNIIEGQHRFAALESLGVEQIPVSVIEDLTIGVDMESVRAAVQGLNLHPDQQHQLIQNSLELAKEAGSGEAALRENQLPEGYEEVYTKVLMAIDGTNPNPVIPEEHAYVGLLRNRPMRGETGRPEGGVPVGPDTPTALKLTEISHMVVKALGFVVRQGRITRPRALGIYNQASGVVRLKEHDAYDVLVHEGGHALNFAVENKAAIDGLVDTFAAEVIPLAYQGTKKGDERIEGFAEWFRMWMTSPGYTRNEVPAFTRAMEEWLATNRPELARQLGTAQQAYKDWKLSSSRDITVGDIVEPGLPPIKTRVGKFFETEKLPTGQSLYSFFDRFYTWTVDSGHPINRMVKGLLDVNFRNTGNRIDLPVHQDPYKLARLATSAYQAAHSWIIHGVIPRGELDNAGPSVVDSLEMAIGKNWFGNWKSDSMMHFGGYLVARQSIYRFQRWEDEIVPRPPLKFHKGDMEQAIIDFEAANPQFRQAAELLYDFQANLWKLKLDAGLISPEAYAQGVENRTYVPFQRDFQERLGSFIQAGGVKGTGRQANIKRALGSLRSVINPLHSIVSDAYKTAALIAQNDVKVAIYNLAREVSNAGPGGGAIAEIVKDRQVTPIRVDVIEALRAAGRDAGMEKFETDELIVQLSEITDTENFLATIYKQKDIPEGGDPIVYVWIGGKRKAMQLADGEFGKDAYEAITQLGTETAHWITKALAIPARGFRTAITTHPAFLVANYLRDQTQTFVISEGFIPFASSIVGVGKELVQARDARLYASLGGMMAGANTNSLDQTRIGQNLKAFQKKGYSFRRFKDLRETLKLTEVTETGTRLAVFSRHKKAAMKRGLSEYEAAVEATYIARDIMDFGKSGSKTVALRKVTTFLNASIQGLDKFTRASVTDLVPVIKHFQGVPMTQTERRGLKKGLKLWLKVAIITGLSAMLHMLNRDDEEYQNASDYFRATHWMIKVNGEWWVAPKGFELATFFNFGERLMEGIFEENPIWFEKWRESLYFTLMVPTEPIGLMLPLEIAYNYDNFRDRPIVPPDKLGLEAWRQYNTYTSELSKVMGEAFNMSPAKIDHVIMGQTGGWGRDLLNLSNGMFNDQRGLHQTTDWPIVGRFVKNFARGGDSAATFYDLAGRTGARLERKSATYKDLIKEGNLSLAEDHYDDLRDDEKIWTSLNMLKSADEKRVHPLRRTSDMLKTFSGMRRQITQRNITGILMGKEIALNPTQAWMVQDQLSRWAMAETRNSLIVVGEPGWAGREIMETDLYLDTIEEISPEISKELGRRLNKIGVLSFEGVKSVWPDVKERLLEEGPETNLLVLSSRARAMGDGLGKSKFTTTPQSRFLPQ